MPRAELRHLEQARNALARSIRASRSAQHRAKNEQRRGRWRAAISACSDAEHECYRVSEAANQLSVALGVSQLRSASVQMDEAQQRLSEVKAQRTEIENFAMGKSSASHFVNLEQVAREITKSSSHRAVRESTQPSLPPQKTSRSRKVANGTVKGVDRSSGVEVRPTEPPLDICDAAKALALPGKDTSKDTGSSKFRAWRKEMSRRVHEVITGLESMPQGLDINGNDEPRMASSERSVCSIPSMISDQGSGFRSVQGSLQDVPLASAARRLEISLRGLDPYDWGRRNDELQRQNVRPADALSTSQKMSRFPQPLSFPPGDSTASLCHTGSDIFGLGSKPMSPKSDKLGRPDALNFTENERVSSAVVHAISDVSLMRKLLVVDDSPVLRKLLKKNFGRYVCHSFPLVPMRSLTCYACVCSISQSWLHRGRMQHCARSTCHATRLRV